ncbi:hypothetical protein ACFQ6Q_00270 [Streptomyces sp. NPDC056437]|uniref:hypothetical protein n=1 Tax=Streptomyces sp. NPDC056437 TaxID=3345816 RepID=UPI0036B18E0B
MTTTDPTTAPDPAAPSNPADDTDQTLTDTCESSGAFLAGLIAAGMLDHVGTPKLLPTLLFPEFPNADPALIQAVWDRALPVGFRCGQLAAYPKWTPEGLDRMRQALREAGYEGMGRLAGRSANTIRPRTQTGVHPADTDHPHTHDQWAGE